MSKYFVTAADLPARGTQFEVGRYECPQCGVVCVGEPDPVNPNNQCRCGTRLVFTRKMLMDATP